MSPHIAPPSSRLKKQSPRKEEDLPEGDCAIYAKRRVIRLRIAHKPAVLTRGGQIPPGAVRPGLASTMKNHLNKEKKAHPSTRCLHASQDKTSIWIPSQEVPKAAFAILVVRRVTWARIVQMVTLLNPTLSIMIFISLGMTKLALVL
jgi:hypothetical protein